METRINNLGAFVTVCHVTGNGCWLIEFVVKVLHRDGVAHVVPQISRCGGGTFALGKKIPSFT